MAGGPRRPQPEGHRYKCVLGTLHTVKQLIRPHDVSRCEMWQHELLPTPAIYAYIQLGPIQVMLGEGRLPNALEATWHRGNFELQITALGAATNVYDAVEAYQVELWAS